VTEGGTKKLIHGLSKQTRPRD